MATDNHPFDTNQSGQIVRPSLHDGWVAGLVVREGAAQVLLEDTEKRRYSLHLRQVERLLATDFREGNIILDVVVRPCQSDDGKLLARLHGLQSVDKEGNFLAALLERAVAEGALIVEINPSYGCSIVALCKQVEMTADDW